MKLDKLIRVTKKHAEDMYAIVLEKNQRDREKFLASLSKNKKVKK